MLFLVRPSLKAMLFLVGVQRLRHFYPNPVFLSLHAFLERETNHSLCQTLSCASDGLTNHDYILTQSLFFRYESVVIRMNKLFKKMLTNVVRTRINTSVIRINGLIFVLTRILQFFKKYFIRAEHHSPLQTMSFASDGFTNLHTSSFQKLVTTADHHSVIQTMSFASDGFTSLHITSLQKRITRADRHSLVQTMSFANDGITSHNDI